MGDNLLTYLIDCGHIMNWRIVASGLTASIILTGCGKSSKSTVTTTNPPVEVVNEPEAADFSKLAAALKSSRPDRLQAAIDMAMKFADQEDDPIPTLLAALNDPTCASLGETSTEKAYSSREAAVKALLKLGPTGKAALLKDGIKPLKAGLSDAKAPVREHTVNAFSMMGTDAKPFVNDIAPLAGDEESAVRSAAYRALEKSKVPATTTVLKLLVSDDSGIASDAAASLSVNKVNSADAVPFLVAALRRKAPEGFSSDQLSYVKNRSAEALAGLGKNAESAIPELIEIVQKATVEEIERMTRPMGPNERTPPVPGQVLALRRIGRSVLPSVMPLLKNDQAIVRYQAALILAGIPRNSETEVILPEVMTALSAERGLPSGQMYVFEELFKTAVRFRANPEPLIEQLLALLASDSDPVRFRAVNLFKTLDAKAVIALPKLREKLADPEPLIQVAVLDVIRGIGPSAKDAAEDVSKLVESKNEKVSRAAVQALKEIGRTQAKSVPALVKLLGSNDRNVVIEAAQAIAVFGPTASEAVEPLNKILMAPDSHADERKAVLATLTAIGPGAKTSLPTVVKLTSDKDYLIRGAAVLCLGAVSPFDQTVQKVASERLMDGTPTVRVNTLRILAGYGAKANASVPDIKKMMDGTKAPELKVWCAVALSKMGVEESANTAIVLEGVKAKNQAIIRMSAMDALVLLGSKAQPSVTDLLEALKDKSPPGRNNMTVREKAIVVCGQLAPYTKSAIVPISELLKDSDKQIRKTAAETLGMYGPEAIIAVATLRELADSNDRELREIARKSLARIEVEKKVGEDAPK